MGECREKILVLTGTPAKSSDAVSGRGCGWRRKARSWGDEGKHRARLYAMHSFGALPRTRPPRGRRRINAENKKE